MRTVKDTTKTTITLIIFFGILYILTRWFNMNPNRISSTVLMRLQIKAMLGSFNARILSIAFWALLIVGTEITIIHEYYAFGILKAFAFPLIMSAIVTILAMIPVINLYWFWASYFVLLIIGVFCCISSLSVFVKSRSSSTPSDEQVKPANKSADSPFDHLVETVSFILLLPLLLILVIALIVFFVRYKGFLF